MSPASTPGVALDTAGSVRWLSLSDCVQPTPLPRSSDLRLPPYSYVPGLFPHPTTAAGHGVFYAQALPAALVENMLAEEEWYRYAVDLFNHGYYWEAHETWEQGWHAAGRRGPVADFLKGLIKMAAAGVKAREGREEGIIRHTRRAAELFSTVAPSSPRPPAAWYGGLDLVSLITAAERIAAAAPVDTAAVPVRIVLPLQLCPIVP